MKKIKEVYLIIHMDQKTLKDFVAVVNILNTN